MTILFQGLVLRKYKHLNPSLLIQAQNNFLISYWKKIKLQYQAQYQKNSL